MKRQATRLWVAVACLALAAPTWATAMEELATVKAAPEGIKWAPLEADHPLLLTVSGPDLQLARKFTAGKTPWLAVRDERLGVLPDGRYQWELRSWSATGRGMRGSPSAVGAPHEDGRAQASKEVEKGLKGPLVQSGSFMVSDGRLVNPGEPERAPKRDPEREGAIEVEGDLTVAGKKAFRASDPSSSSAIVYVALEGPEAGTYFRGSARAVLDEVVIDLPDHFARVTESEGLTVQLTPVGAWSRLYVAEISPKRLVVRNAEPATPVDFDFLVQGVRRGYGDHQVVQPAAVENNQPEGR